MDNIIENNKLIAEFMGYEFITNNIFINRLPKDFLNNSESYKCFHNSWDWLMPVVDKIESFIFQNDEFYNFNILGGCYVIVISSHGNELITSDEGQSKLECVYIAIIEFIKWYNQQNKS